MRLGLVACLLIASFGPASAAFRSGNDLYADCSADSSISAKTLTLGYVMGVSDAVENAVACPNRRVGAGQMKDVVCTYLRDHPESREKSAGYLAVLALAKAWPCPQQ